MSKYHHLRGDMKQVLGHIGHLSQGSQKYYRLAINNCSMSICACKDKSEIQDENGLNEIFKRLNPCPKIFECQTYEQWKQMVALNQINRWFDGFKLHPKVLKLCLLPVGPFPDFIHEFQLPGSKQSFWDVLAEYLRIFFTGSQVEILPECDLSDFKVTRRVHHMTNQEQCLVTDFFPILKSKTPKDCYCLVAVTWSDLCPTIDLNFVLGQASFLSYCCVASFGRFDPTYLKGFKGNKVGITADEMKGSTSVTSSLVWKMIKIIVHEACHVFGLSHCSLYYCIMNASSSSEEALSQPMLLCPVCMRKIQHACSTWPKTKHRFDVQVHLASILQFLTLKFARIQEMDQQSNEHLSPEFAVTNERVQTAVKTLEFLLKR